MYEGFTKLNNSIRYENMRMKKKQTIPPPIDNYLLMLLKLKLLKSFIFKYMKIFKNETIQQDMRNESVNENEK